MDTRRSYKAVVHTVETPQVLQQQDDKRKRLNLGILCLGCICLCTHWIILLVMFFVSGTEFISEILLNTIWYSGLMTMCFLIDHMAWVYVLWVLSCEPPPYWRLTIAYIGILVACISWVMDTVVPLQPNPMHLHSTFCQIFIVGCLINLMGSVLSLPGRIALFGTYKSNRVGVSSCDFLRHLVWHKSCRSARCT